VRYLKPVEKIEIPAVICPVTYGSCPVTWSLLPEERRASRHFLAELKHDNPSWLRHVRGVTAYGNQAAIKTGTIIDKPGKALGRTICASLLEQYVDEASLWGVPDADYNDGKTLLVNCR
jgi:hypothetical protein